MNRQVGPSLSHVFLAGFAGSGKTTIGKIVARKLKRHFVDLDRFVEESAKHSIVELMLKRGEREFRRIESQALAQLCETSKRPIVISLGGGTLLATRNRRAVAQHGIAVYLRCSIQELVRRLQKSYDRPLLRPSSKFADLDSIVKTQLRRRKPGYRECNHTIIVTNLTPKKAAQRICELIR